MQMSFLRIGRIRPLLCATLLVPATLSAAVEESFTDYVDITISGYSGSEVLTNYPALIRLSETTMTTNASTATPNGFSYARAGENGADLCFVYKNYQVLPYEVDTWQTNGESLVWVLIPEWRPAPNSTKIRLYWSKKPEAEVPENHPEKVWQNFYGVWHMNQISPYNKGQIGDSSQNSKPAWIASGEITFEPGLLGTRARYGQINADNPVTNAAVRMDLVRYDASLNRTITEVRGGTETFTLISGRLAYDEVRLIDQETPGYATWKREEIQTLTNEAYTTRGIVSRDGRQQDYWTIRPSLTQDAWDEGTDAAEFFRKGELKSGADIVLSYRILPHGTLTNELPTTMGEYVAVFDRAPADGWELAGGPVEIPFLILGHSPNPKIAEGDLSGSGRILLANDDYKNSGDKDHPEVNGQGWCEDEDFANAHGLPTYWSFPLKSAVKIFNLHEATESILWRNDESHACLWHLQDCRQGNLFPTSDTTSLAAKRNYLPYSPTALSISAFHEPAARKSAGWIVMRNVLNAAITSGCLTNGVGTVYFDTVNFRADREAEAHNFVLEYLTQSDCNAITNDAFFKSGEGETLIYSQRELEGKWHTATMVPMVTEDGAPLEELPATEEFGPGIATGGSQKNFYRVRATLNVRQPVRFRIRRTAIDPNSSAADGSTLSPAAFVLFDNIIVSEPPQSARLVSAGSEIDLERLGKWVLGSPCAFSQPFPSITDHDVYGRAKLEWLEAKRETDMVTGATMHYRWRYLNQVGNEPEDWQTVKLDQWNGFRSVAPIAYSQQEGDIEFYFSALVRASYFEYSAANDYSGARFAKPTGDFKEEIGSIETHVTDVQRVVSPLASCGTDWFVRLRNGKSDWQDISVEVTEGVLAGAYRMELTADSQWRALVPIKAGHAGEVIRFRFRGENLQTPGADYVPGVMALWSPTSRDEASIPLPDSGRLRESDEGSTITLDEAANYLVFKMSDKFLTYSVARAEKQDFNDWNDVANRDELFTVSKNETNGVDAASMLRYEMVKDLKRWAVFDGTNDFWNETFYLTDPNDPGFPQDIVFAEHDAPTHNWKGKSISFVLSEFISTDNPRGGFAGKLLGQGKGRLEYAPALASFPDGIDTVSFAARVGQSVGLENVGSYRISTQPDAHMIFTPLTMSHACSEDGKYLGDMAVGASISLIECYDFQSGCYEFRISRPDGGRYRTLTLYKWFKVGGVETNVVLCSRRFGSDKADANARAAWTDDDAEEPQNRRYYGAFLSFENYWNDGWKTRLICGITSEAIALKANETLPAKPFSGKGFDGFIYEDAGSGGVIPWTGGTFGFMAKDCPAQFIMPIEFATPMDLNLSTKIVTNKLSGTTASYIDATQSKVLVPGADDAESFIDCRDSIVADIERIDSGRAAKYWSLPEMRLERIDDETIEVNHHWVGLRTPTNLAQVAILQVKPNTATSEEAWTNVAERIVTGYSLEKGQMSVPLRLTGEWNIRLTTGPDAVDVVFDDVRQTQWHVPDDEAIDSAIDNFTFTQSHVERVETVLPSGETTNLVQFTFEPSRADPAAPVSLRSPILDGLGHISFRYDEADADAEVWLQVATNHVTRDTLINSYNSSLVSVEPGESEPEGAWITIRRFGSHEGCDEPLGTNGTKSVYLGWHNPIKGVFRLFVPTNVVTEAVRRSHLEPLEEAQVDYGRIVIRGVSVTDEPEISERAWRGWNIRTLGDVEDTEKRMYLADSTREDGGEGSGLSCALNNTTNITTLTSQELWPAEDLPLIAAKYYPAIYSPTFGQVNNQQCGVGEVSFKARLYATPIQPQTPGRIVIYGAHNSLGTDWQVLATNEITSSVFSNFTWSASGESYSAIKFEVTSAGYLSRRPDVGRVIIDEIVVSEKIQPTVGFVYARPFRQNLSTSEPIDDILSPDEQPLAGESWGIQAQVSVQQLEDEIDLTRGFRVFFSYYRDKKPWGYEQWKDLSDAILDEELIQVGESSNLIFRSSFERARTLVEPASKGGSVVQFMLKVKYYDKDGGEKEYVSSLNSTWQQPSWYFPVDFNRDNGALVDATKFSGYTILDTVSPGRAWINEVNWNDGSLQDIGGTKVSTTNQFIEVCIPSGVDMKDWYVKVTGVQTGGAPPLHTTGTLFKFGKSGVPSVKTSPAATNGYEFFVVQSPLTANRGDGGIKGIDGKNAADGIWSDAKQASLDDRGTFSYYKPYQFELYRPSGVLEHQFVLEGTNTMAKYGATDSIYDGTNLVAALAAEDVDRYGASSTKRFFAGRETGRRKSGALWGSAGVVGGTKEGEPAPGAEGTWESGLKFTPGSLNEGQIIPEGWFLPPNGTNSWIYVSVEGAHLYQQVGTNTANSILIVIPSEGKTNVTYWTDSFYELDCITVNGVTNETPRHVPCKDGFDYVIDHPQGTMRIVAHAGMDVRVLDKIDMAKYGDYAPSIVNWLSKNWPDRDADDIVLADYQCVNDDTATKHELNLIDMYWLDLPPFTDSGEKEWTLRAGVTGFEYNIPYDRFGENLSDIRVTVKMYKQRADPVSGEVLEKKPITYLQGLDNARSDDKSTYAAWQSETFKVRGALDLNGSFMPFRTFIFNSGSFAKDFTSVIEILDPFSVHSPGLSYGWNEHPEKKNSNYWGISLDTDTQTTTIETLKADDTY